MRTSQDQRSTEKEGLRHSCLRQRPPRNAKARAQGLDDHCGFDLHVRRADRSTIAVEVNGRMRSGEIELSPNEWAKACNLGDRYWLYVVYDCATAHPRPIRVQNPFQRLVAKGGNVVINAGQIQAAAEGE